MCKTGQPHRWQARVQNRTNGTRCPYDDGHAVCPCTSLANNHPEVAAEWDWEANGDKIPETVAASSNLEAAWSCGLCGHSWSTTISHRTLLGTGCPQCACEAGRIKTRHPSISNGAPHLLAEWDWEANETHGWRPDQVTLGSNQYVHWVVQDECKLGLVHRWQAAPRHRALQYARGSPYPSGQAVCACNSLAVQCPEAATLWDHQANGVLTPDIVTVQSAKVACWQLPDGRQWHQRVNQVVDYVMRHKTKLNR